MIDNEEFDISNEYKEEELGEAVHYGDLGQSRWETRHSFMSGDRDTGGFGTGVYFLSKKLDYNWENRPTHEVDINKYNLYKPKDYDHAKLLHDTLRDICNYDAGGPNIRKRNSDTDSDIDFSDYWWYTDAYDGNKVDKDIYSFALQLNRVFNYRYDTNELARIIKKEMKDEKDNVSLATHILQDLGWNGVNVTDIPEMDNPTYGSVVFNLDESLDDDFRLPKKLKHYGLHAYFSGDAIIFARAFKDKEKAKNIVSISKNECGIPARLISQKDKFCVYICRQGFPKGFEGWDNIKGLKEDLEEKKDDHAPDAVDYFGTTNDMNIAGYLTKDGQFISLGEEGYLRGDDHRVISAVYDDDEVFETGTDYLIDFMKEGNIRLIPEQPGIDLIKEPTQDQYSSLYKFVYYFWSHIDPRKDSFIFNVSDNSGYDIGYKEFSFSENTPTKILNGIKDYYVGNLKLNEDFIDNSNKEYLLEKTRNELITKSKRGDRYKDQSKGKNRWERRTKSSIANTVDNYNKIDMDSLWKKDILDVGINVKGETADYVVRIKLKGVIKELAEEVKANHQNYEFKCVYRAIQTVMNSDNVWVSCSCPDFYFTFSYVSTKDDYNSGDPQSIPADIKNPSDTKGAGCKHINLVLGNIRWIMKVCSVINNYVHYMKRVKPQLFADYIFPKIFDMPYNRAVQLDLFGDQELKSDTETISLANEYNRKLNQFKNPDEYQYYDTKDTMGQRKNPVPEKPTEQEEPSEEQHESLQLHEDTKEKTISVSQLEELAKENNQEYKFFEKVNGLANKYKEKGTYYSYWVLQDGTILECMHCHCSIECWIAQNFIINGYEVEDRDHIQPIQEEVERLYDYDLKEWKKGTQSNLSLEDFLEYAFTYCLDDGEYYAARNWGAIRITIASGLLPSGTTNLIENFHIQVPEDFAMTSAQLSSTKKLLKEFVDKATLKCRVTLCSVFNQHEKRFLDFTEPDKTIDNVIQNLQVFNSSHKFRNENVDEQLSEELYKNVYHGTVVDFDRFDAKYIDWAMGGIAGFWFTSDKDYATDLGQFAGEYGAKVLIEADLLINHPIYLDINDEDKTPLTIKKENVKRFVKEVIKPKFRYTEEELDGYVNALYDEDIVTDHNILTNLLKDFDAGNEEEVLDNIYDYLGVDGYILEDNYANETSYVVFSDSQILNRNKTYIEDELYESKQDTNNFISWFGQDLTDRFLAVKQRLKSPEKDFYYWKDKTKEELEDFLTQVETTKNPEINEAYIGKSMSVRAKQAYDNGEKPISKWTKQEILDTLENEYGIDEEIINELKTLTLPTLRKYCLTHSSWHHTGKFYNETDFYSIYDAFVDDLTIEKVMELKQEEVYKKNYERNDEYRKSVGEDFNYEVKECVWEYNPYSETYEWNFKETHFLNTANFPNDKSVEDIEKEIIQMAKSKESKSTKVEVHKWKGGEDRLDNPGKIIYEYNPNNPIVKNEKE